jgi:hypothetical protein
MREIYGKAWAVVAWLGEERDHSDKAFQLVQCLSEYNKPPRITDDMRRKLLEERSDFLIDGSWLALLQLMERPYWSRLWIIQEIVMGAFSMVIRCGTSLIDWNSFCLGIEVLQEELWVVKDALL